MNPLDFVELVWSVQGQGFGFLSYRGAGQSLDWHDVSVTVPDEDPTLPDPVTNDVYFTPNLFSRPRRRNEFALPSRWLYADLDNVDPESIGHKDEKLRPDVAWRSSDSRYQAMWLVQRLEPATHERINKQLTYKVGADKGGWDLSQVLRVPGTLNHKYRVPQNVELLWFDPIPGRVVKGRGMAATGNGDGGGVPLRVVPIPGKRIPTFVRSRLRSPSAVGDRSRVLYKMEVELLAAHFSMDEVFTLLRGSVWNKFDDVGLSNDIRRVAARVAA